MPLPRHVCAYWTYDCATSSDYSGQRGDGYVRTIRDGDPTRTETRRAGPPAAAASPGSSTTCWWSPAVPCSAYLDRLEPWTLSDLAAYDERYLAASRPALTNSTWPAGSRRRGEDGAVIRGDVHRDIGGDSQTISALETAYDAVTFQACAAAGLAEQLPLWRQALQFRLNGRHRRVQGQRPWSWLKIGLVVLAVIASCRAGQCCTAR